MMKMRRHAFTLIESLLAISIAATVLLTMLALLPAGLDASREAARRTTEARILARMRQQCAVVPGDYYFDGAGRPLTSRNADAVYAVRVASAAAVVLPGDASGTLQNIRIALSDRLMNEDPFADLTQVRVQSLLLAPITAGGAP